MARSEVCLRVNKAALSQQSWSKLMSNFREWPDISQLDTEEYYHISMCDVKWDRDFPEVGALEDLMSLVLDDDEYGFIRIGEEINDIEQQGEPSTYDMYVSQTISY